MPTRKYRKRRKRGGGPDAALTVALQPGEVPTDDELDAEAAAIEDEAHGRYEEAKKDDLSLTVLRRMGTEELHALAEQEQLEDYSSLPKQKLVFEILRSRARKQGLMMGEGTLAILPDGFGFLRSPEYSYLPSPDDVYVGPSQIRRFGLRKGQIVRGLIRPPKETES